MSPFEYVTVLISIILGMGITQIVTGVADLVHQWNRVRIYWPHLLWIIFVFFFQIQEWWATFELRKFDTLRLPTFLFVLLYPINLFVLARILFPLALPEGTIDLRTVYMENYRRFFLWASFLPVLSVLNNVFVTGHPLQSQVGQLGMIVVFITLTLVKKVPEWIHQVFATILVLITLIAIAVIWNEALTA